MKMNLKKGFTLIELLVVIGIVALLAAITLVSISGARNKGADAGVKTNLNTVRAQAGIYFGDNGNSYLPSGGSTFAIATCPTYSASGTNMFAKDFIIAASVAEAVKRGGNGSACYNSSSLWAVSVGLKSGGTTADAIPDSWCIDSGGVSKGYAWATGETIVDSINGTACR